MSNNELYSTIDVIIEYYNRALSTSVNCRDLAKNYLRDCGAILGRILLDRIDSSLPMYSEFTSYFNTCCVLGCDFRGGIENV